MVRNANALDLLIRQRDNLRMTRRLLFALLASPLVRRLVPKPLLKAGDRIQIKYIGTIPVPLTSLGFALETKSGRILPVSPRVTNVDDRPVTFGDGKEYTGPYFVPWG